MPPRPSKLHALLLQPCPAQFQAFTEGELKSVEEGTFFLAQASEQADLILAMLKHAAQPSTMAKNDVTVAIQHLRTSFSPHLPMDHPLPPQAGLMAWLMLRSHGKQGKEQEEGGLPTSVKDLAQGVTLLLAAMQLPPEVKEQAYAADGWPGRTSATNLIKDFHIMEARCVGSPPPPSPYLGHPNLRTTPLSPHYHSADTPPPTWYVSLPTSMAGPRPSTRRQ